MIEIFKRAVGLSPPVEKTKQNVMNLEERLKEDYPHGSRMYYVSIIKGKSLTQLDSKLTEQYKNWVNFTMCALDSPYIEPVPDELNMFYMAEPAQTGDQFWGVTIYEEKSSIPTFTRAPKQCL